MKLSESGGGKRRFWPYVPAETPESHATVHLREGKAQDVTAVAIFDVFQTVFDPARTRLDQ